MFLAFWSTKLLASCSICSFDWFSLGQKVKTRKKEKSISRKSSWVRCWLERVVWSFGQDEGHWARWLLLLGWTRRSFSWSKLKWPVDKEEIRQANSHRSVPEEKKGKFDLNRRIFSFRHQKTFASIRTTNSKRIWAIRFDGRSSSVVRFEWKTNKHRDKIITVLFRASTLFLLSSNSSCSIRASIESNSKRIGRTLKFLSMESTIDWMICSLIEFFKRRKIDSKRFVSLTLWPTSKRTTSRSTRRDQKLSSNRRVDSNQWTNKFQLSRCVERFSSIMALEKRTMVCCVASSG